MATAQETREILPGVVHWSAYSPHHKVELSSTAVRNADGWWVFDPIPLMPAGVEFLRPHPVAAIVLTNENHERDSANWSRQFPAQVWAAPEATLSDGIARRWISSSPEFADWHLVALPGGPRGETAFVLPALSLAVFGDAVVHLPGRGLELLPDKYCRDPHQLRASLRHLPVFDSAFFAHGEPLLGQASAQIAALLTTGGR